MWSRLPTDQTAGPIGIISNEAPTVNEEIPDLQIQCLPLLTLGEVAFVLQQDTKTNRCLLDLELNHLTQGLNFRIWSPQRSKVAGLILAIPHQIRIRPALFAYQPLRHDTMLDFTPPLPHPASKACEGKEQVHMTCYSTHLCVEESLRKKGMGMLLIREVVTESWKRGILTGYHFTPTARSQSAISVKAWYRPLDLPATQQHGYRLVLPKYMLSKPEAYYHLPAPYTLRPSQREDFKNLLPRALGLEQPQDLLGVSPLVWVTLLDGEQVVMVTCYRRWELVKEKRRIKAALLVYVESTVTAPQKRIQAAQSLFAHLRKESFVAVHGIETGCLCGIGDELRLIRNKVLYLDFYNLRLRGETALHASQCSVLYI